MRIALTIIIGICWTGIIAQSSTEAIFYSKEDVSIQQIFSDLESEYGIRFSYATSHWTSQNMDVDFNGDSVEDILDYLLKDQQLEYKIVSDNILLRKSPNYETKDKDSYKKVIHLKGRVAMQTSQSTGLAFAMIAIDQTSIGTYSNEDGSFDLEVPSMYLDRYLSVKYIGYEEVRYKISELENEFILVPLKEDVFVIEEITVVNKDKPIRIDSYQNRITLSSNTIANLTSGLTTGDVNRSIQLLPGITAFNDNESDILIRGSNSDQTISILDGMPLYGKGHYYGIFSAINGRYIDQVNIYKNTYPVQYNGGVSGLVEYIGQPNKMDSTTARFGLDLLTVNGIAEIVLNEQFALKIGGRSTLRPISNEQFNTVSESKNNSQNIEIFGGKIKSERSEPQFDFYDVNVGLLWKGKRNNSLAINVYRSADQLINKYQFSIDDANQNRVGLNVDENQEWNTTAASVNWSQSLGEKLTLNSSAFYSDYNNVESNRITIDKKFKTNGGNPNINNPKGALLSILHENYLTDLGLNTSLNYTQKQHTLTFGISGQKQDVEYAFVENKQPNFNGNQSVLSIGGYGGYKYTGKQLGLTLGLRSTYYSYLSKNLVSPRTLLSYTINDHIILKSSFSIHQQVIRQFYYEYRGVPKELWIAANDRRIPVINSQNIMFGATLLKGLFTLDVEAFQKYQKGVTEYAAINPDQSTNNPDQARDYRLFIGDGLIRGLDVLLSTKYRQYNTQVGYTLSWNDERYKSIFRNNYFPSENDRRHQLKWSNSLDLDKWTIGVNFIYASGRPYTDIGNIGSIGDIREIDPSKWLKRLPDYNRIDLSVGHKFKIGRLNMRANASVFNLLNTQNVKYVQSVLTELEAEQQPVNTVLGNDSALLNRTLNVGLEVIF